MKNKLLRILRLFNFRECIMCGYYRYKRHYNLSGGGIICAKCSSKWGVNEK